MENAKSRFPIWGWFYVFFAIVFTMNAIMVYLANSSWNGLSTENAYEKGLKYNDVLKQKEQQQALGWNTKAAWEDGSQKLTLYLQDKNGTAVESADVEVVFFRPTTQGFDQTVQAQAFDSGWYQAVPQMPLLKGQWQARGTITQGENILEFRHDFMVK